MYYRAVCIVGQKQGKCVIGRGARKMHYRVVCIVGQEQGECILGRCV